MKKTQTRIYRTDVRENGNVKASRLVRTTHPSLADSYVASEIVSSRVATQADLEELFGSGVKVEDPNAPKPAELMATIDVAPGAAEAVADGKGIEVEAVSKTELRIFPAEEPAPECVAEEDPAQAPLCAEHQPDGSHV